MHPNPVFHVETQEANLAYAAARGFGVLSVNGAQGPLVSHVPFLVEDGFVWLHLVRSNPIVAALAAPAPAVIAVIGPDSYVSPDWYGVADQVPTWNYVAVHLRGALERRPQAELKDLLDRQSAFFENQLAPKRPWTSDKMSDGVMDRMMRAIVPCRMRIDSVDGTWKLGQNKGASARLGAADALELAGLGAEVAELARLMRED